MLLFCGARTEAERTGRAKSEVKDARGALCSNSANKAGSDAVHLKRR